MFLSSNNRSNSWLFEIASPYFCPIITFRIRHAPQLPPSHATTSDPSGTSGCHTFFLCNSFTYFLHVLLVHFFTIYSPQTTSSVLNFMTVFVFIESGLRLIHHDCTSINRGCIFSSLPSIYETADITSIKQLSYSYLRVTMRNVLGKTLYSTVAYWHLTEIMFLTLLTIKLTLVL